jgi:hypothetical protein
MSGPIVRTGTTPKFWQNYDNIFGSKKKAAAPKKSEAKAEAKSTKKTAKKSAKSKKK